MALRARLTSVLVILGMLSGVRLYNCTRVQGYPDKAWLIRPRVYGWVVWCDATYWGTRSIEKVDWGNEVGSVVSAHSEGMGHGSTLQSLADSQTC